MTLHPDEPLFRDAVQGLRRGDFSRLEPLFAEQPSPGAATCRIVEWCLQGRFDKEPEALAEALACACFLGRTNVVDFLLARGVDPEAGAATGMNAFHWAANRGNLDTVKRLIERDAPLETKNMYGGTVLDCCVWSAIQEPRGDQLAVIEALLRAGARVDAVNYPTGHQRVDEVLRRHGAGS